MQSLLAAWHTGHLVAGEPPPNSGSEHFKSLSSRQGTSRRQLECWNRRNTATTSMFGAAKTRLRKDWGPATWLGSAAVE